MDWTIFALIIVHFRIQVFIVLTCIRNQDAVRPIFMSVDARRVRRQKFVQLKLLSVILQ